MPVISSFRSLEYQMTVFKLQICTIIRLPIVKEDEDFHTRKAARGSGEAINHINHSNHNVEAFVEDSIVEELSSRSYLVS